MNNIFSFSRFAMLFKKHTLEHAKIYLMSAGVLAGLLFLALGFIAYTNGGQLSPGPQAIIFIFFFLFAGSIFTSLSFSALGDKRKAIPVLTLPASNFEKYLVSWVYSFLIFQLVFIGVFYLADGIVLSISTPKQGHNEMLSLLDDRFTVYYVFLIYLFFHALSFWGAIFFEKMHFIKTAFVFFACAVVLVLINQPILNALIDREILKSMPFDDLRFMDNDRYFNVEPEGKAGYYHLAIIVACAVLLWCSAFFRLKEKEV